MKINYFKFLEKKLNTDNVIKELNQKINLELKNLPCLKIVNDKEILTKTKEITNNFSKNKNKFFVFGTGGSNLGARALINIIREPLESQIEFYDNIDPIIFQNSFNSIDFKTTGFVFISKSGSTPETLSQLGSIIHKAEDQNSLLEFYSNTLIITEFKESALYKIAKKNKCLLMEHQQDIGGRFSVFSNVGMVPAIIAGMDVNEIFEGAKSIIDNEDYSNYYNLANIFNDSNHINLKSSVIMTYSDNLYYFGKWYLQLWSESIGKENKGVTAIHSVGTTDQHSQLQLYLDGPKDKFFTFITTEHSNMGLKISDEISKAGINFLANKKMGDLMEAEQRATIDTFKNNSFKIRNIFLPKINAKSIGKLMAVSIIETVAACRYLGVDPFNQPAVEEGKILTKKYLIN